MATSRQLEGLLRMPLTTLLLEPAWPPGLTAPVPQHAIGAVVWSACGPIISVFCAVPH